MPGVRFGNIMKERKLIVKVVSLLLLLTCASSSAGQNDFRISLAHPLTPTTYGEVFPIDHANVTGYTLYKEHKWEKHNLRLESFWICNMSDLTAADLLDVVIEVNQIPSEIFKIPNVVPVVSEAVIIQLKLSSEGALKMSRLTERNIGRRLAIILNNDLIFCATIYEPMTKDAVNLGGIWTQEEAKDIANRIRNLIKSKPNNWGHITFSNNQAGGNV